MRVVRWDWPGFEPGPHEQLTWRGALPIRHRSPPRNPNKKLLYATFLGGCFPSLVLVHQEFLPTDEPGAPPLSIFCLRE